MLLYTPKNNCITGYINFMFTYAIVLYLPFPEENRDVLSRSGFFHRLGKKWLFPSMQDAVNHAQHGLPLVSVCVHTCVCMCVHVCACAYMYLCLCVYYPHNPSLCGVYIMTSCVVCCVLVFVL